MNKPIYHIDNTADQQTIALLEAFEPILPTDLGAVLAAARLRATWEFVQQALKGIQAATAARERPRTAEEEERIWQQATAGQRDALRRWRG